MPPEEQSPLDNLTRRIYEAPPQPRAEVPAYSSEELPKPYGWQAPPPPVIKKHLSWTVRFLIGAGVFLVLAGLGAAFLVIQGTRSVSSDRVTIGVNGPPNIASGDVVPIVITVHNGNPAAMQNANIFVTLPDGTRAGDGSDAPLTQYTDTLGTVAPGADVTRTVQVKLYGTENQALAIPVRVEYHTDGSNALFSSQKQYSITVATSPITVQVQSVSQTPSGQPLTLNVLVRSNASSPLKNVALMAQYPSGFSVRSADPVASGNSFYVLGDIAPGEQKTLKVTGVLVGQDTDQRVFHFTAGSVNTDGTNTLGDSFATGDATIAITHPFLNVGLTLNQQTADTLFVHPGDQIGALLTWKNALTDTLTNASIQVAFGGNALDTSTISGGTGFYRSTDKTVVFSGDTDPGLTSLSAGDSGAGSFSFAVKPATALAGLQNPTITLAVSITGQHAVDGAGAQTLTSTVTRTIKVGTTVSLASTLSRTGGTYTNTGPTPPVAGTESTYTVALTAKNTINSVGAAKATMKLPSYVNFTGKADSGITYASSTRIVSWSIGDLTPNATATAYFQIAFLPSSSQAGYAPQLIGDQSFTGIDRFTQAQVTATAPALSSELPGDISSGTVH